MAREGADERRRNENADSKVEPSTVAAAAAASSPKLSSKKVLLSDIMLGKSSSSAPATAASSNRLVFVGQKAGEYGTAENGAGCNINGNRTSEGLLVHQACIVLRGVLAPGAALCSAQRPRVDLATHNNLTRCTRRWYRERAAQRARHELDKVGVWHGDDALHLFALELGEGAAHLIFKISLMLFSGPLSAIN